MRHRSLALVTLLLVAACSIADDLEAGFHNPPAGARPRVWWHWMNGNITQDGITEDLRWMKRVGIAGLQNFDASLGTPQVVEKRLAFMTPQWQDAFRHAASLAADLDLELAIATSAGWSETGGPWVTPQQAMKKVVWSATLLEGGRRRAEPLPQPPGVAGPFQQVSYQARPDEPSPQFYVDTQLLAFPAPQDELADRANAPQMSSARGVIAGDILRDGDLSRSVEIPVAADGNTWIKIEYPRATTISSATLTMPARRAFPPPTQFDATLQASDDGTTYRTVAMLAASGADQRTVAFAPVKARWFRVVFEAGKPFTRAVAEGVAAMQFPPPPSSLAIAELALHPRMHINRFVEKAGFAAAADYYAIDTPDAPRTSIVPIDSIVDLTGRLRPDGTLDWVAPAGKWLVLRLGYSLTGHTNGPASPEATGLEVDKLNPAHVRAYLTHYLDMYEGAAGKDLIGRRGVRALLSDSYEAGAQNWTENMLGEFARLRGYDARRWLPALAGWIVESSAASDRFLWDFRRTIADLLASAHYGQIKEVARERGLMVYGEALEDERPALGDDMAMRRYTDIPMAAMWMYPGRDGPNPTYVFDHLGAASVAHVYGQNIAAAESLTSFGYPWAFAPRDLQPVTDLQFALGINRIVVHTSVHQPLSDRRPGMSLRTSLGQYFSRTETWAEQAAPWVDYLSRNSFLLQQGQFVADVAYFYGQEAPLTGLQPQDSPRGFGFDFVNDDVVLNQLKVEDGQLITPSGMRYRMLYLGGSSRRMTLEVLRKVDELTRAGAQVGGLEPTESPSLADDQAEFRRLAAALWDTGRVRKSAELNVPPDFELQGPDASANVMFLHRRSPEADIYFVTNRTQRTLAGDAVFRVAGMQPQRWDAESGQIEDLAFRTAGGRTFVPLELAPLRSALVVFRRTASVTERRMPKPVETVVTTIASPWRVRFDAPEELTLPTLVSWTERPEPDIRYFSGTATYSTSFDLGAQRGRVVLDLGDVRELATVSVNGKAVGTLWRPPFRVDVTNTLRRGRNQISIAVTNLWVNRLIGDAQPGAKQHTFTTGPTYRADAPLRPSGLLGPVRVLNVD